MSEIELSMTHPENFSSISMLTTHWMTVTSLGILQISGDGARKLLQGQLTCDVATITTTQASLGALCNIKGRAMSGFYLALFNENYYLIAPRNLMSKILQTLKKYALFFPVTLTDLSDQWTLLGLVGAAASTQLAMHSETVSLANFCSSASLKQQSGFLVNLSIHETSPRYLLCLSPQAVPPIIESIQTSAQLSDTFWQWLDIQAGLSLLDEKTSEIFVPLELNYEKLAGISFKKGCYTGQEVIARIYYRGYLKQQLRRFIISTAVTAHPLQAIYNSAGDESGQVIQVITDTYQTEGLALIREDQLEQPLHIKDALGIYPCLIQAAN